MFNVYSKTKVGMVRNGDRMHEVTPNMISRTCKQQELNNWEEKSESRNRSMKFYPN